MTRDATGLSATLYTSPRQEPSIGTRAAMVAVIDGAKHTLDVGAYAFNSVPIGDAILRAHLRKVKVRIVADGNQAKNDPRSQAVRLQGFGVPVRYWGDPMTGAQMHLKMVMVDGGYRRLGRLSLGSANLTTGGDEVNTEIMVVLSGTQLADSLRFEVASMMDRTWAEGRVSL